MRTMVYISEGVGEALVERMTRDYLADVGRIAEMPGVTLIEP